MARPEVHAMMMKGEVMRMIESWRLRCYKVFVRLCGSFHDFELQKFHEI